MYTDTEGVIFRQVKTLNNRRMALLFSKKYGKISAGTSISEKGRSKSALAMRPFTHGSYELYKNRDSFYINGAEVIKSYYRIGEDVEKYMYCSYILEFTEKLLPENVPAPDLFRLLTDYLDIMERRHQKYESLLVAYQVKALQFSGSMPQIQTCAHCGSEEAPAAFSVKDGGVICSSCRKEIEKNPKDGGLIYPVNFGIIEVLEYFLNNSLRSFENLGLEDDLQGQLRRMIKSYSQYHLDIGELKSEGFLKG